MRLLLDTHFIVWLTDEPQRLSSADQALIFAPETELAVSAASIWEIRIKWESRFAAGVNTGRRELSTSPDRALRFVTALGVQMLPISAALAAATLREPISHRDPFDELLLVQAQEEGMRLLTRDRLLAGHSLVV